MEALQYRPREDGYNRTVANFSNQVVVALDHLTSTEREGVYTTVEAFARHEEDGDRLPLPEPSRGAGGPRHCSSGTRRACRGGGYCAPCGAT